MHVDHLQCSFIFFSIVCNYVHFLPYRAPEIYTLKQFIGESRTLPLLLAREAAEGGAAWRAVIG